MAWSLSFDVRKNYDTRQVGITLPVTLRAGGLSVDVAAKLDCAQLTASLPAPGAKVWDST
jgi:hypothetical protein